MKIYAASKAHVPALSELDKECFPGWKDRAKTIEQIVNLGYSFVAVSSLYDELVGSVLVVDQEFFCPDDRFVDDFECMHIQTLGVKETYRRKGIARRLLQTVHERYNHTTIQVKIDNKIAKSLYRDLGYKTISFTAFS